MPEGDTVWLHAHRLDAALAGQLIVASDLRVPQYATADLAGTRVREVVSRGKHLLMRFDPPPDAAETEPTTLRSHLRMDGTWRIYTLGKRWDRPAHTARVVLTTATRQAVGFHLHDIRLIETRYEETLVGHLGPDLCGDAWSADDVALAVARLRAEPTRAIEAALLDQRNLAGVGNLYKSELLFLRGLYPWLPVGEVDARSDRELAAIVALARRVLMANRARWDQVTTGDLRRGQSTYVYPRGGSPCRRCGTPIRRAEDPPTASGDDDDPVGSDASERVTFWCPRCQPDPAPPTR